eukprot:TRINITY_DN3294_c0_g1_i1.p1 TRINITY_DN3294_c0_g1~~TRINITY_DN3294_c0_g1_i1.p1  ORF type:complete len:114 (-),score=12.92 TRINITY_DN3294_c0_g1_i1:15-356(-)
MNIHPVFHVSLLEPAYQSQIQGRHTEGPPSVIVNGQPEFEIDEILDSRVYRRQGQYLIKWLGYDLIDSTWEPHREVDHLTSALAIFHSKHPDKPGPWNGRRRSELALEEELLS